MFVVVGWRHRIIRRRGQIFIQKKEQKNISINFQLKLFCVFFWVASVGHFPAQVKTFLWWIYGRLKGGNVMIFMRRAVNSERWMRNHFCLGRQFASSSKWFRVQFNVQSVGGWGGGEKSVQRINMRWSERPSRHAWTSPFNDFNIEQHSTQTSNQYQNKSFLIKS